MSHGASLEANESDSSGDSMPSLVSSSSSHGQNLYGVVAGDNTSSDDDDDASNDNPIAADLLWLTFRLWKLAVQSPAED